MKIAILGGTFNPLHIGHCMIADSVATDLGYDRVLFVPANIPPHKQMGSSVDARDRLNMVEAFCSSTLHGGTRRFFCEDCEIVRSGVSYTYDTVCFLLEKYSGKIDGRPALIIGEEGAAQFEKWHESEKLASLVDFIVARRMPPEVDGGIPSSDAESFLNRPSGRYEKDHVLSDLKSKFRHPYIPLENPSLSVSSTQIRLLASSGRSFRYLVPEAVFYYIKEHKLYG